MADPNIQTIQTPSLAEVQAILGLLKIVIAALVVAVSTIVMATWRAAKQRADETEKMRRGEAAYLAVFGVPEEAKMGLNAKMEQVQNTVTEQGHRLRGVMEGLNTHGSQPHLIAQHVNRTLKDQFEKAAEKAAETRKLLLKEQDLRFDRREEDRSDPYDTIDEPDPFPSDPPPNIIPRPKRLR